MKHSNLLDDERYDTPRPCFNFTNTSPITELEMFIIVINILSGSGDLSDSPGKGLLKKVIVCDRRGEIQLCD